MKARIPIATIFLAAATLFLGESAAAQRRPITESYSHGPNQESCVPGIYGGHGQYGRTVKIRAHSIPRRVWTPGHYEWVMQQVWVPGCAEKVWVEPVYEWRLDYRGNRYQVLVRGGHWEEVIQPGHYESRQVQVWRPGYWRDDHLRHR